MKIGKTKNKKKKKVLWIGGIIILFLFIIGGGNDEMGPSNIVESEENIEEVLVKEEIKDEIIEKILEEPILENDVQTENESFTQDQEVVKTSEPIYQDDGKKWYVSSHHSSRFYYCEESNGWEGLSSTYLMVYNSEAELKANFPNHTLHESCL